MQAHDGTDRGEARVRLGSMLGGGRSYHPGLPTGRSDIDGPVEGELGYEAARRALAVEIVLILVLVLSQDVFSEGKCPSHACG